MNTNKKIYSLVIIGVFAAIISIISAIPLGFEIFGVRASLQTFAMALAGFTLGHKKGTLTVFIYILIGAIGLPVYSCFTSGFGVLFGVSGGFIFGFLLLSFMSGISMKLSIPKDKPNLKLPYGILRILISILGLTLCHILGILWAAYYLNMTLPATSLLISVPYIAKDIISLILAYLVALSIKKAMIRVSINI